MKRLTLTVFITALTLASCKQGEPAKQKTHDEHVGHEMSGDELHLSDQQIQLGNIIVDSLRERTLGDEFLITGIVTVDQTKATSVASRVMGRIEKLYFKNIGETVEKGEILYEIFSEELNIAIRELQLTVEKINTLKNDQVDMQTILESSRARLSLYGLSDTQIKELEKTKDPGNTVKIHSPVSGIITAVNAKEGDYIMEGATVLHLADLTSLWVEGQVYSDYLNFIKNGLVGRVTLPGYPEFEYESSISFINPELNPASKINLVRIQIPNARQQIKPGVQAYINVLTNEIKSIALPTDAVILDGKGATVWIQTGKNMFKSKMVKTGLEANGYTQITGGLQKGDRVVVSGAYLLNSEYIFQKGTNPMEGHDMSKM
jgi:membrane fusion protein, copper/silver efflux system